jgi:arginine exporter protein ArgO
MLRALGEGVLAGFGIAIPVGPIAVLIVDTAIARGFGAAAAAGLGTASADIVYALIAVTAGTAAASVLRPHARALQIVGAVVLGAIAVARVVRMRAARGAPPALQGAAVRGRSAVRTYLTFLGLTLTNPTTVVYFAALIVGSSADLLRSFGARALFVVGAFAASASWQLALAGAGAALHHRLPGRARAITSAVGTAIIAALAVRLAWFS